MNNDTSPKIAMLKGSFRCFVYGIISLLPIIGVPFAVGALWNAGKVRVQEKRMWNAARPYRIWGVTCAIIGLLFGIGVFTIYALITIQAMYGDSN